MYKTKKARKAIKERATLTRLLELWCQIPAGETNRVPLVWRPAVKQRQANEARVKGDKVVAAISRLAEMDILQVLRWKADYGGVIAKREQVDRALRWESSVMAPTRPPVVIESDGGTRVKAINGIPQESLMVGKLPLVEEKSKQVQRPEPSLSEAVIQEKVHLEVAPPGMRKLVINTPADLATYNHIRQLRGGKQAYLEMLKIQDAAGTSRMSIVDRYPG